MNYATLRQSMPALALVALALILTPDAPTRRPMLWIVGGTPRMFLYGTIHVADERVTQHLPVVQQALDQSTALYTELAMDPAGMVAIQQATLGRARLPEGQTLTKLFGPELHARVAKCLPAGTPLALLDGFKPWLITMLLIQTSMLEHQEKLAAQAKAEGQPAPKEGAEALDPMLFNQALAAGKQVGGLEEIDAQLDAFDNLPLEGQVDMVRESVIAIEKARAAAEDGGGEAEADPLGAMVDMWLLGDDGGFAKIFRDSVRGQGGDAELFVYTLLDKRNVGMAKEILRLRGEDPSQTYFFAVGSGHMPGPQGIVRLLQRAGLKVRRVLLGEKLRPLPVPAGV